MAGEIANLQVRVGADTSGAERSFTQLAQHLTRASAAARTAGQAMRESGASGTSAAAGIDRVATAARAAASAKGQASSATKELTSALGQARGAALGFAAAQVGLTSATQGLSALFRGTVGAAASFEQRMNVLQQTAGASAQQMAQISAKAKQLGADLTLPATSANDAAAAMLELSKAGLSVADTMNAAKGVLQLSAAGQLANADAAEITANALNAFKLAGTDAIRVADLLAAAANASSAGVGDVALAMQQASAVFNMAKLPIEDLIASIGMMANAGIKGSDAGTSLKAMLQSLLAPSDEAAGAMAQYGIQVRDASGNIKPMAQLVQEFTTKLGPLTAAQRDQALATIFGSDAIRAAQIVMMGGTKAFTDMTAAVTKSGAAQDLAAAQTKGLLGAWKGLQSQLETLGQAAGEQLVPALTELVRLINAAMQSDALRDFVAGLGIVKDGAAGMNNELRKTPELTAEMKAGLVAAGAVMVVGFFNPLAGAALTLGIAAAAALTWAGSIRASIDPVYAAKEATRQWSDALTALADPAMAVVSVRLREVAQAGGTAGDKAEALRQIFENMNRANLELTAKMDRLVHSTGKMGDELLKTDPAYKQMYKNWMSNNAVMEAAQSQLRAMGLSLVHGADGAVRFAGDLSKVPEAAKTAGQAGPPALDPLKKAIQDLASDADKARKALRDIIDTPTPEELALGGSVKKLNVVLKDFEAAAATSGDTQKFWIDRTLESARAAGLSEGQIRVLQQATKTLTGDQAQNADEVKRVTDLMNPLIQSKEKEIEASRAHREAMGHEIEARVTGTRSMVDSMAHANEWADVLLGIFPEVAKAADGSAVDTNDALKQIAGDETKSALVRQIAGLLPAVGPVSEDTWRQIMALARTASVEEINQLPAAIRDDLLAAKGAAVGQGFAGGILSTFGAVRAAAQALAAEAEGATGMRLESQSPSRVFMRLGRFAAEGFALGITDGAGLVQAAASALAELATTATGSGALRLARDIAGLDVAIAELKVQLANTEAYSAERAQIEQQMQFLEGWKAKLEAVRSAHDAVARAAELAKTPLEHFTEAASRLAADKGLAAQFGGGADIVKGLAGVFDKPESAGQLAEALSRWLSSADIKSLPGLAGMAEMLWAALRGYLASPSESSLRSVLDWVQTIAGEAAKAGELSAGTFATRFAAAMNLEGLRESMGSGMGGAFAELTKAIEAGGEGALDAAVGFMTAAHQELRKLPEFMRGKLGAEMKAAWDAYLTNPSKEALAAVQEASRDIHEALALLPGDFEDMASSVQQAILAIIAAVDAGTLSIEEGGKRIKQLVDDTKKAADEAKRAQEEARRDAEKGAPPAESSWNIDTGNAGHAASGTARTNAGGIAGLTHSSVKAGDWQVEIFSATAALIAASSEFLRISRMGAFPAGTTLAQALGFAHQATFEAWEKAMKAAAGDKALRWGAAGREARGEWGGGALGAMDDAEFEQFLGTLSGPERDRARAERERAQAGHEAAARDQQTAATGQLDAAQNNRQTADIEADTAEKNRQTQEKDAENTEKLAELLEEARANAPDRPADEDEGGGDDDEDEAGNPKKPKKPAPAYAAGGVVSEFARLVNAAGQTIGTMAEQGPEAIVPMGLFTNTRDLLRRFAGSPHLIAGEAPPLTSGAFVASGPGGGGSDEALVQAVARGVAEGLHGALVQMDGQEVGRLVSRAIARDALLAGVNR